MLRSLLTPLLVILLLLVAFTYKEKNDGQKALKRLYQIEKSVQEQQDSIALLEADWALLTEPGRLKKLAEIYHQDLNLLPATAEQILPFSAILEGPSIVSSALELQSSHEE